MHFDIFKRKYISVGEARGDGMRHESSNNNASANEIIQEMKPRVFVSGNSFREKEEEMEFMLDNFKGEKLLPESFKFELHLTK